MGDWHSYSVFIFQIPGQGSVGVILIVDCLLVYSEAFGQRFALTGQKSGVAAHRNKRRPEFEAAARVHLVGCQHTSELACAQNASDGVIDLAPYLRMCAVAQVTHICGEIARADE